tara:strand:+ start:1170 stop:1379 length:210 start_codon:yes stop_codon:yes gene_type:complete
MHLVICTFSTPGIRFFAGGEIYSGTWLDDKKHGRGVFKNAYGREELKSYDRGSLGEHISFFFSGMILGL